MSVLKIKKDNEWITVNSPLSEELPLSIANGGTGNTIGRAVSAETANTLSETLEIAKGGTGAATKNKAAINLLNYKAYLPEEDTPEAWAAYGTGLLFRPGTSIGDNIKCPSEVDTYGHILHIPYEANSKEFCQIWITAPTGKMYVRGCNNRGWSGAEDGSNDWKNIALQAYPVGSVYMSFNATSPAEIFGGNWTRIKHSFLYGAGDTSDLVNTTGGEVTHTLTVDEMPSHRHILYRPKWYNNDGPSISTSILGYVSDTTHTYYNDKNIEATGGDKEHNNMPPYICVYMWYRDS